MKRVLLALYRVRGPVYYVAGAILIANLIFGQLLAQESLRQIRTVVVFTAVGLLILCVLLGFLVPRWLAVPPVRVVQSPVRGRWMGVNSPATPVPSHGVRMYGQAYAIDLVAEPLETPRPQFGGQMMRASAEYPAFGAPVMAMIDGTVVRATDWRRDHRSRSNSLGLIYLMIEGMIRELGGPGFIIGNHVTIRSEDGVYATIAHLQQGSVAVKVGDRVTACDLIGKCGNSGNSSEPHVHAQLADRASFWTAQGLPLAFADIRLDDALETVDGLPQHGQHMLVV